MVIYSRLPEEHQKLFTVEYAPRKEGIKVIMDQTFRRVRRHQFDGEPGVERSIEHKSMSLQLCFSIDRFSAGY